MLESQLLHSKKPNNQVLQQLTVTIVGLLVMFALAMPAWGFEWQVQGQGYSISVIPGLAAYSVNWGRDGNSVTLVSDTITSLKLQYRSRNQDLESTFFELQYQKYKWAALPRSSVLSTNSDSTLGGFAGGRTSSRERLQIGYSFGATQDFFISSASTQRVNLEKHLTYHARGFASLVLWAPAFGANAAADSNVLAKDSPKLRIELMAGALSPHKQSMISKYWGWEISPQISYGNSIQWVSLQYEANEQNNAVSNQHRSALRLEFSLSLDRQKQREEGSGW